MVYFVRTAIALWLAVIVVTAITHEWWGVLGEAVIGVMIIVIVRVRRFNQQRLETLNTWREIARIAGTVYPVPELLDSPKIELSMDDAVLMDEIIAKFDERFVSGNSVPIEQTKITAAEWEKIKLWLQKSQIWVFRTETTSSKADE